MLWLLIACVVAYEGDDPGECSDGADNDRNGYFDCVDLACANSPDCVGETDADTDSDTDSDTDTDADTDADTDTDTDTDSDTDTDTDADTDADTDTDTDTDTDALAAHLLTYEIRMDVSWVFTEGFADCNQVFEGSGAQVSAVDTRVTFSGPYAMTDTTCTDHATLEPYFPWAPADGEALSSFVFSSDMSTLDVWFADDTEDERYARAEWYVYDMFEPYDDADQFVRYSEVASSDDGTITTVFQLEITFN
jgi:hypothetical protein